MLSPWLSIKELRHLLEKGELSPRELVQSSLDRFARHDEQIGAALELFDIDSVLARSKTDGPLAGIPGLLKDNICIKDRAMSCASRILEGYVAPYNATVTTKLEQAGALCLGRANMDEFAMGSSTRTSAYRTTRNPWDLTRSPGGSSGGSVAAVAAGLVPWALGTETGGSVRHPAALCGVVGSKPTYGLVSRYGVTAYASSMDQVGVATRTVYDNALVLATIAGRETVVRDGTARALPADYSLVQSLTGTIRPGLRIGVLEDMISAEGVDAEVTAALHTALKKLEQLGAILVPLSLETMRLSAATYFVISRAEVASNLARFDGVRYGARAPNVQTLEELYTQTRTAGFGQEGKERIMIGSYVLSYGHADAYYRTACQARALMRAEAERVFSQVDLLFSPVTPTAAFPIDAFDNNALQLALQDAFTCWANLVGIPALAVPCGFTPMRLPIGFQLMGPYWSEPEIFSVAYAYEQATDWYIQACMLKV